MMTAPPRLPDWRRRLTAYLAAHARTPFAEGRHDCGLFTGGAVKAMTGVDVAEVLRGRYTTTRGAIRVLRHMGFEDHVAFAASLFPEADPTGERGVLPGDIVAHITPDGPALGIWQGQGIHAPGSDGLTLADSAAAIRFFEV